MGAFLLFPVDRGDLELTGVQRHFSRRGFAAPNKFVQDGLALWI